MGDNLQNTNIVNFGPAQCNVGISGACFPDQPLYIAPTMARYNQRREGESCYGAAGVCAPGLYCSGASGGGKKPYTCCRLPWDAPPTVPYYSLYRPNEDAHKRSDDAWYQRNYERFLY